jgi:hypothetical protein
MDRDAGFVVARSMHIANGANEINTKVLLTGAGLFVSIEKRQK